MFEFMFNSLVAAINALIYMWDDIIAFIDNLLATLFSQIFSYLPSNVQDGSAFNLDLSGISTLESNMATDLYEGILWFLPISESILMIVASFGIVGAIRLVRWCLGLIPTLSLG